LITRGLLDPDHAARALGEQHDVAAALQRHLENREPLLAKLLPAPLGRAWCALPIGRLRGGELVVCVRDPRPELHAALEHALGEQVVIAVAPAHKLEGLIDGAYDRSLSTGEEWEVDMSTPPVGAAGAGAEPGRRRGSARTTLSEIERLTLVSLDDDRVVRDATQAGPRAPTPLPPGVRANRPSHEAHAAQPDAPARPEPVALDATIAQLATVKNRDAATDVAMRFAAGRWTSALLLTIKEGAALGHQGHGPQLPDDAVQAAALPLSAPSIVKEAFEMRRLVGEPPARPGAIRDRLHRLLGGPTNPAAAPVLVGQHVACVLVVGDPYDRATRHLADLEGLVAALGAAYLRVVRDKKG
jgi:hypothetical protein